MLCSPSHSSAMLPYATNHGLTSGVESSSSSSLSTGQPSSSYNGDIRTPSPSVGNSRPRHHARSFSQEKRFDEISSSITSAGTPTGSSTIATIPKQTNVNQLPVRAKRSPSIDGSDQSQTTSTASSSRTSSSSSQASMPRVLNSASIVSPSLPRRDGSPPKVAKVLTKEETEEQEKLAKLRKAQASRRPRVMRMTPAFSSLPGKIDNNSIKILTSNIAGEGGNGEQDINIQFPSKSSADSNSLDEPSAGLQIDLACIPTPSLQDLQGPVTTSHVESMLRDRKGNPIKPSLKTPRSSVSHFLPGRTTRSDSTPSLPMASLTSKSVPTTPTVAKNVHFDSQLEHVKVFKFKQRPAAVSRDGSPEQTETETEEEKEMFPYIWKKGNSPSNDNSPTSPMRSKTSSPPQDEQLVLRLPNFPSSTRLSVEREVFLERIFLADDLRSVKGTVQVRNMSFEKWVAVRYTLDHWATIGEVSAEFSESLKGGQTDRFSFSIKLNELLNWPRGSAAHETKSMFICLRYTVSDGEFWDNNEGQNYQLDFRKRPIPTTPASTPMPPIPLRASVPESISNSTTRSRVMEMAKRGVGGKGVFAMEDLKRELEKLRSDDEEELPSPIDAFKRRNSPPASPSVTNNGRSSSPSVWTARYDFGQSLRNPRSGSRKTGEGRAAALDYFSARPMNNSGNGNGNGNFKETSTPTPSFSVQAASPPTQKTDLAAAFSASSFNAKFGMISPGLGDENVEHMPVNPSSGSATPSPGATPTMSSRPLGGGSVGSNGSSPDRYYSFPPSRHATSPGSTTPTNQNRLSPVTSMDMLRGNSDDRKGRSPLKTTFSSITDDQQVKHHEKESSASSTEESMQSSPRSSPPSDGGSPNPFSPSISVSSIGSDTTISNVTSPDSIRSSSTTPTTNNKKQVSIDRMLETNHQSPSIYFNKGLQSSDLNASAISLTSISSGESDGQSKEEDPSFMKKQYRPASMSDYQELVDKFCWNSDLVPSGGSMIPDMPVNGGLSRSSILIDGQPILVPISPSSVNANGSGASTPTGLH